MNNQLPNADNESIKAQISTEKTPRKTRSTKQKNSQSPKISIQYYNNTKDVANQIKSKYAGKSILVAAHSDTVEQLVQDVGAGSVPPIGNEFNNLLIVTIPSDGTPSLTRMKYEIWPSVLSKMGCKDAN